MGPVGRLGGVSFGARAGSGRRLARAAVALHRGGRARRALRSAGPVRAWDLDEAAGLAAHGWGLVAAGALLTSRLGVVLFGVHEPITELTAVHYVYAGVGR